MYNALWDFINGSTPSLTYCINCARRYGKTFVLSIVSLEFCIRNPNNVVTLAMPLQKEARAIIRVTFKKILSDCPEHLKPTFNSQDSYWKFPNGSELHIRGVNNGQEDDLRGNESSLAIVDEAGQVDNLKYLVMDILLPQLLTTGGKLCIASTPPPIPGHYYRTMYDKCKMEGNLSEYNVHENTRLSQKLIDQYCKESGGEDSSTWKREYLIQFEVDESLVIVPEWKKDFVEERERPDFFKWYKK